MKKYALSAALISAAMLGGTAACSSNGSTPQAAATTSPAVSVTTPASAGAVILPSVPSTPTAAPQSWLAPAQVPFDSTVHWTGGTDSTAQSGATLVSDEPILYPCADHGYQTVAQDVTGFKTNVFAGSGTFGFNSPTKATQSYIAYSSATAAQSAFQAIKQDLTGCAAQSTGTSVNTNLPMNGTVVTTSSTADSLAYTYILRDSQGQPAQTEGNYSDDSDYHTYVAVDGTTVEILWLCGGSVVDDTSNDASVLQTLATTLN